MGRGGKFRITVLASLGIHPADTRNRNLLVLCLYVEKLRHGQPLQSGTVCWGDRVCSGQIGASQSGCNNSGVLCLNGRKPTQQGRSSRRSVVELAIIWGYYAFEDDFSGFASLGCSIGRWYDPRAKRLLSPPKAGKAIHLRQTANIMRLKKSWFPYFRVIPKVGIIFQRAKSRKSWRLLFWSRASDLEAKTTFWF